FLSLRRAPVVIFPSSRKIDGVDLYCEWLMQQMDPAERLVLYENWSGKQYPGAKNMSFAYAFRLLFARKFCRFLPVSQYDDVSARIEEATGVSLNVNRMATILTVQFKIQRFFYKCLFRLR